MSKRVSTTAARKAKTSKTTAVTQIDEAYYSGIHDSIVSLLESARHAAARSVNAVMTASYWAVGQRIVIFEQGGQARAEYGDLLIERLAVDLSAQFGRGFSKQNLWQMRAFFLAWPPEQILQTLSAKPFESILETPSRESSQTGNLQTVSGQFLDLPTLAQAFPLPWSAYVRLLSVKNEHARSFYETEALRGGWSVRQLDRQVNSQFYERTALSRNKAAMLELGDDFAFVGRQRRLRLDDTWFRLDLLLFHRSLKCLLVIDLKVGKFSHADAGQMHMYLNYAREHWTKPGENPPVGLILCTGKGEAQARYTLAGMGSQVLTAEYRTVLPDEELLTEELNRTRRELEARHGAPNGDEADQ